MPPRQPHIQGQHLAYVPPYQPEAALQFGVAFNVGAPHQPDADLHLGAAPVSSLGAAPSAYLASHQPGAAIQFGAATATSLGAAPPATWCPIVQMPPHHPDAVRQPKFILVWHPTEVPPYQPDAALHFGAPSSLDDAPSAECRPVSYTFRGGI